MLNLFAEYKDRQLPKRMYNKQVEHDALNNTVYNYDSCIRSYVNCRSVSNDQVISRGSM